MTDLAAYRALCAAKRPQSLALGMPRVPELASSLFDHQKHGVEFALRAGRSALFYDTGLGKTRMMLEWGRHVVEAENKPVLMLAPLAVSAQHIREAERMGVEASISRFGSPPSSPKIVVTNYERLERFDPNDYAGVILDESSIIKNFSGVTTKKLIDAFSQTRWRLAGSATPAPNDHTELGTHSEFLSVMRRDEMLVRWFIHDSADTKTWRVKGHAVAPFWDWVASWARCVSKPSDLGFSDDGFALPPLNIHKHIVASDRSIDAGEEKDGQARLFRIPERSATSIHREKRMTADARAEMVAQIVAANDGKPICIWVDTDYEAEAVRKAIPGVVEVHGRMQPDQKEELLDSFTTGATRVLLVKPKIAGQGLNWQHCHCTIFCGLSFSYEAFYQAVRRFWRFGQKTSVDAHVVLADTEAEIAAIVERKSADHDHMKAEMAAAMMRAVQHHQVLESYHPHTPAQIPAWLLEASQ
jgi:superfamily II DNA or RNA helicase